MALAFTIGFSFVLSLAAPITLYERHLMTKGRFLLPSHGNLAYHVLRLFLIDWEALLACDSEESSSRTWHTSICSETLRTLEVMSCHIHLLCETVSRPGISTSRGCDLSFQGVQLVGRWQTGHFFHRSWCARSSSSSMGQ